MSTMSDECTAAERWVAQRRDEIVAAANAGNSDAIAIIRIHRMLVRNADVPTWGMFLGAVDGYRRKSPAPAVPPAPGAGGEVTRGQ